MGRKSQRRHADHKPRARVDPPTISPTTEQPATEHRTVAAIERLIATASYTGIGPNENRAVFARIVRALTEIEITRSAPQAPSALIATALQNRVSTLYENGWQPADIAHSVKRQFAARAARLAIAFIATHARATDAIHRAPQQWLAQFEDLGVYSPRRDCVVGGHEQPLAVWARAEKLDPDEVIAIALQVLAQLTLSPKLSGLTTPPSAWGDTNRGLNTPLAIPRDDVDAKALKLIRALLAKAEATTFEAEAETFTAKAQQMMTRYSIDVAVLASAVAGGDIASGIETRRVHIDSPYADEKADLLSVIGAINGARAVWSRQVGIATIMGFPVDLQLTDLLFTSLLVQATKASADATANDRALRTPSFRRAFLIAFADRIGERLEQAQHVVSAAAETAYGSALVPLLANREAAVAKAFDDAFPFVTSGPSRRLNASGWYAGRAAADRAHLGASAALSAG